ncbi:VanZ family protein [Tissierella sp. MSJ-40]|uniref:VanZ family protein n=1 Tax=Tissierella simiarum TaxID=2841534 RepID=A0ABS6E583_9FIRM|nr:VanZ family protein [Tissierella simiarum]MBU5438075.1 VanZ family protein [Tissierella simiarum]
MESYLFPIKIAFITFPFIALFFTFPFAIYQYKKYGYINKFRIFILYSFLLYLIVAYYLIILPLPQTRDIKSLQRPGTQHYNLVPFSFIHDILRETSVVFNKPSTYKYLLTERAFLQAVFNAILLLPLGVYLRYYFKKDLKKTIATTFFVSLFFEVTQLTGLYGIYNAPYRLFDVDDLFLNTLGGYIGYVITPMFTFFLPNTDEIDKNINLQEMRVSYFRRGLAFLIDINIVRLIPKIEDNIIYKGTIYFIYFILIAYLTNGKTIGNWLTSIKIKGEESKLKFSEIFIRYTTLYFGVFGVNRVLSSVATMNEYTDIGYAIIIIVILQLIINLLILIHFLLCIIRRDRFFYEKFSDTSIVISKGSPN